MLAAGPSPWRRYGWAGAFASDLNPVAVLLNKVVLEYIPKYSQRLADEVRKWGQWVKEQAENVGLDFFGDCGDNKELLQRRRKR